MANHKIPSKPSSSDGLFNGTGYTRYGQGGQTLVFIHGVGLNRNVWQPQVDYFANRYQVLTYDILGHGDSHRPDEGVTLNAYAEQLAHLLDHLQMGQVSVIGHSMGALISVAFALTYPEKVHKLVPMNIVYQRSTPQRDAVVARAERVLAAEELTGIETTLKRWFADKTDEASRVKIAQIAQWMAQVDPVGYGRTYKLFATSDDAFRGQLHQLSMPVLYLTGENDPNSTPAMSHQMAAETPQGQAMVVSGEAHMMAYICPEKVNPLIEKFLAPSV